MRSFRRAVLSSVLALGVGTLVAVAVATSAVGGTTPSPTPTVTGPQIPTCPPRTAPSPTTTGGPTGATPRPCIPAGTGSLSGRVTDDLGAPAAGASVWMESATGGLVVLTADEDGRWEVPNLPAGSYTLRFAAYDLGLVTDVWRDEQAGTGAGTITLADGEHRGGLDVRLARGVTVSGRVVVPTGTVPPGTYVRVERVDVSDAPTPGGVTVAADGTYELDLVPAGTYRVEVVPPPDSGLSSAYHPGVRDPAAATLFTLTAGQRLEGVDLTPLGGQGIAGTVTLPAGADPSDLWVVVTPVGDPMSGYSVGLAADGTYRFSDLAPGEYLVLVQYAAPGSPVLSRYYPDSPTAQGAQPVLVTEGSITSGIDVAPVAPARVTGVVTGPTGPLPGVQVTLEPVQGGAVHGPAWTGGDGSFTVVGAPAGDYRVRFTVPTGGRALTLYYRAPDLTTPGRKAATTVHVEPGATLDVSARVHVPGPKPGRG